MIKSYNYKFDYGKILPAEKLFGESLAKRTEAI